MSKRYLRYETEHENPLVDEHGVLKTETSVGSGGYKYFGVSYDTNNLGQNPTIYKMDTFGILNNPSNAKNGSDVTKTEFETAYRSQPILLVPVNKNDGQMIVNDDSTEYATEYGHTVSRPVVGYIVYVGTPNVVTIDPEGKFITSTAFKFATE